MIQYAHAARQKLKNGKTRVDHSKPCNSRNSILLFIMINILFEGSSRIKSSSESSDIFFFFLDGLFIVGDFLSFSKCIISVLVTAVVVAVAVVDAGRLDDGSSGCDGTGESNAGSRQQRTGSKNVGDTRPDLSKVGNRVKECI